MTRLNRARREPRTNGRPMVAPTDEIKIFCFIAYGSSFLTDTTLDSRQLVAWTHGPYKFDIIFMFRQQTDARRYAFLHPTHPPQAVPLLSQEKATVNHAFGQ